jgi:hypothetical protein
VIRLLTAGYEGVGVEADRRAGRCWIRFERVP